MYKFILYLVLVSGIVGSISYKFYELNSEIKELNNKLELLNKNYNIEVTNALLAKSNNDKLKNAISRQNSELEKQSINYNRLYKKWEYLENQPPVVKYKTIYKTLYKDLNTSKLNKGECEEGLKLNSAISKIKYKDL